jgi:hypothetical protein
VSDPKESAAERLARAYIAHADSVARGMVALRDGSYARAERELDEAEAAYRAAPPAAEPAPRTTTTGAIVSALAQMGLAQLAEPAAQPFPGALWVCAICDGGPANDCACSCPDGGKREPAKEPAPCRHGNCGCVPGAHVCAKADCPSCRLGGAT